MRKRNIKAQKDFAQEMLPATRREVFFDVLKLHWQNFLLYGFIILMSTLPMHIVSLNEMSVATDFNAALTQAQEGQAQELIQAFIGVRVLYAALKIPSFVIIALVLSGILRVIRQYAWEENVTFFADFAVGFRENAVQMSIVGLLAGVFYAASSYMMLLAQYISDGVLSLALMAPMGAFILIIVPMLAYSVSSISVYKNKFFDVLKIGITIAVASPAKTLAALVSSLVVFVPQFLIPNALAMIVCRLISSVLIPFIILGWLLFSYDRFDQFINVEKFPELVGKGTFKPKGAKDDGALYDGETHQSIQPSPKTSK